MAEIILRDYQDYAINEIRQAILDGYRSILLCAPTGGGKTVIASEMVYKSMLKGNRAAFLVDRTNLINQTSEMFDKYGIEHGIIQADHWRFQPSKPIQICSVQTLARREFPSAKVVFVDEAHTISEVVKKKIRKSDSIVIGLTATPFTKGLGKMYEKLINVTTTNKLIADGHLSPYRIFAHSEPDMTGVRVIAGEWEENEAADRALQVVGDCVTEYIAHGQGRKFICSAINVAHVEELHRQFLAAGIVTANYTYRVSDVEREQIVKEFKKPDSYIRGLITVTAASKGFDIPDIGVVIMARPLRKSLAEHLQLLGRGLRIAPGKEEVTVLDHSGNCARFWKEMNDFFEYGALELDDGTKKEKAAQREEKNEEDKVVKCGNCHHLHTPALFCPNCGHEYPKKQAIAHVPGSLKELVATRNNKMITQALWPQLVRLSMNKTTDAEKQEKWALAMYRKIAGKWPDAKFSETIPSDFVSGEVERKIKSINIAYAHGMRKRQQQAGMSL